MRIVCPNCSAAYDVPDALLRGRRTVRCAACSREWSLTDATPPEPESLFRPEPPPAEEVLEGTAEEAPRNRLAAPGSEEGRREGIPREAIARAIAMDRLQNAPPPRRGGLGLLIAWVLSFVVLGALAWSAYDWRIEVMNAWPPSIRLYTLLGLA
ncbi:MAG: zinc-ribbon domain-containing protein [Proteobacteria bacterium]|nr:zinc-ribbon domain-containing protein [Pseudomonadota bacterium]